MSMLSNRIPSPYFTAFLLLCIAIIIRFIIKLYRNRAYFNKLRKQGLPMPQHSLIFGHAFVVNSLLRSLPKDANIMYLCFEILRQSSRSDSLVYLNLWPFNSPLMVIWSPAACFQTTQEYNLPKPKAYHDILAPVTGGASLISMKNEQWRHWRTILNPGFSPGSLLDHVSYIVDEVTVFVDILRQYAQRGDLFRMEDKTVWLTLDIVGRVIMDTRFNSQRTWHPMTAAFRSQMDWLFLRDKINPLQRWHPLRLIVQWYNGRQMNRYIGEKLDGRYTELQTQHEIKDSKHGSSLIDLALKDYMAQNDPNSNTGKMNKTARALITNQIRLFFFAGNDAPSTALCYCYYLLFRHSNSLSRLRAEHDEIFGNDLSKVSALILEKPYLLNQIPYTTAVIKESLRLFPPGSSLRQGTKNMDVVDEEGNIYPTEGCQILVLHSALHRSPRYWKDPDSFIPERWLVGPEDPLCPAKDTWRPFEQGPRNCIAQPLAMLELRITLVMTAREFNVHEAYHEWDQLHPQSTPKTANGERAYQLSKGAAPPSDGLPCRVTVRKGKV